MAIGTNRVVRVTSTVTGLGPRPGQYGKTALLLESTTAINNSATSKKVHRISEYASHQEVVAVWGAEAEASIVAAKYFAVTAAPPLKIILWDLATDVDADTSGVQPETPSAALSAALALDNDWRYLIVGKRFSEYDDTNPTVAPIDKAGVIALSTWVSANDKRLILDVGQGADDTAGVNADGTVAHTIQKSKNGATFLLYSGALGPSHATTYASAPYAATIGGINYEQAGQHRDSGFVTLPGIQVAEINTEAQAAALDALNINAYYTVGGANIVLPGRLANGNWLDTDNYIGWFERESALAVFNERTRRRRIPLTNSGLRSIKRRIEAVCVRGRDAGVIGPGRLDSDALVNMRLVTRQPNHTGILPAGFLVYFPPASEISTDDREARKGPNFHVWQTGVGSIYSLSIISNFQE